MSDYKYVGPLTEKYYLIKWTPEEGWVVCGPDQALLDIMNSKEPDPVLDEPEVE